MDCCRSGGADVSRGYKTPAFFILLPYLFFILLLSPVRAQTSITLGWNPVTTPGLLGYKLYYGAASHAYTNAVTVTSGAQATVTGLKPGTIYYFCVTTLDLLLGESLFSTEIRYPDLPPAITISAPTNGATYDSSAPLTLSATVITNGHTINNVRFFNGALLLGTDFTPPYSYTLSKAFSNSYSFHATVTYDGTNSINSPVVNVSAVGSLVGTTPLLTSLPATNRQFRLVLSGQPGHTYDILASENLHVWKTISTVTLDGTGTVAFTDTDAPKYPARFYRLHETTYTLPGTLPTLELRRAGRGPLVMYCAGQVGHSYDILASDDLKSWIAITNFLIGSSGTFTWFDPAAAAHSSRFYRLHETTYTAASSIPALQLGRAGGKVLLTALGEVAHRYQVQASQDLVHWTAITNVTLPAAAFMTVNDPAAASFRSRFYRLHETTW